MSRPSDTPHLIIQPFDPQLHDRVSFSCGVPSVDNFFQKTANKLSKADIIRLFVLSENGSSVVFGFYAINAHSVDYTNLPDKYARNRPKNGSIPAAFLSMIAVDQRFAGKGYGSDLLVDALLRIKTASKSLGIAIVVLDILDCGDPQKIQLRKALYKKFGFQPFPSNPMRYFLPVKDIP